MTYKSGTSGISMEGGGISKIKILKTIRRTYNINTRYALTLWLCHHDRRHFDKVG